MRFAREHASPSQGHGWCLRACLLAVLVCGAASGAAAAGGPVLLTEAGSTRAVALESVTLLRDPFPVEAPVALGRDRRTRIILFATNVSLYAGEGANSFTAEAEDGARRLYPLAVEHAGPLRGFGGVTQLVLRLHDEMKESGDVLVRVSLRGMTSNRVRVAVGRAGGGPPPDLLSEVVSPAPEVPPASAPAPTPDPFAGPASSADAVRFLEQSSFGPTPAEVERVKSIGIRAYLEEQFAATPSGYPSMQLMPIDSRLVCQGVGGAAHACVRDNYTMYPLQTRFFRNAFYKPDQLRQRVAFALHQILVVSGRDMNQASWMVPYLQTLDRHAFGDFRQLLFDISLNPAMGEFLNTAGNGKANPNENFAREILQLFSVGPDLLNPDGTPKLDAEGRRVPVYTQETISNFARVFTGWNYSVPPPGTEGVINFHEPLTAVERNHDAGPKTLLGGAQVAPGQTALEDLNAAIENIFRHPNVGPFVSKRLIRQLVTSNPSPGYVGRVASVFDDDCAGFYPEGTCARARGNMKAVVRAILLDPEARGDVKTDPNYGRLREPAQFVAGVCRPFDPKGIGDGINNFVESDGHLNPQTILMGQDVLRPATVFGYFPSEYSVPRTNLKGPEFGTLSASTATKRASFVARMVYRGISRGETEDTLNGTSLNFAAFMPLASDPAQLVDRLDALFLHGTMTSAARAAVLEALNAIPTTDRNFLRNRTQAAVFLVLSSPQYQVQR
jgi:uncharacterized protein (DUF1800 family)